MASFVVAWYFNVPANKAMTQNQWLLLTYADCTSSNSPEHEEMIRILPYFDWLNSFHCDNVQEYIRNWMQLIKNSNLVKIHLKWLPQKYFQSTFIHFADATKGETWKCRIECVIVAFNACHQRTINVSLNELLFDINRTTKGTHQNHCP